MYRGYGPKGVKPDDGRGTAALLTLVLEVSGQKKEDAFAPSGA